MIEALMAGICVVSIIAGSSWIGGLIVFAPLHERTLLFKIRNRFRIADIISLGILLQFAVGVALALIPADEGATPRVVMTVLISLVAVTWWINGLRMLSRAGVESGLHRMAFLTLVLPTGYVSILLVIGTIILFPASMELLTNWSRRATWEIALGCFLLCLPMAAVLWAIGCHRICRRMANRARDEQAKRDGIEFDSVSESERDPQVTKYLVGRQRVEPGKGIWLDDPIVMATTADEPEPVEGIELVEPSNTEDAQADEESNATDAQSNRDPADTTRNQAASPPQDDA